MDRTEFFRRQADRFSTLARECANAKISAKLSAMSKEYRDLLNAKEPAATSGSSAGCRFGSGHPQ
jgi:hypothetical protein